MRKIKSKYIKYFFSFCISINLIFIFGVGLFCGYLKLDRPDYTLQMLINSHFSPKTINAVQVVELDSIPEVISFCLIQIEDRHFYAHHGIDIGAIKGALRLNNQYGYRRYGASTISQQLARMLFLNSKKSFVRKYFELIATFEIELFLSKDEIFGLYINFVHWGKDIYGVKNASNYYYKKEIDQLTNDEIFRLITILASPVKYNTENFFENDILMQRYNRLTHMFNN